MTAGAYMAWIPPSGTIRARERHEVLSVLLVESSEQGEEEWMTDDC